jgi:N-acetylglucosamine-6-phosphate deacetylase
VVVALGHHTAGYAAVRRAADAGATLLTHLGNGVPHDINRHENPIFAGLADDRLAATLIADGHHLPDELLDLFVGVKGIRRSILVSDAAPVAGLPAGRYSNFGVEVEVTDDGLVVNPRTRYLAGSGRTLLQCVNRLAAAGRYGANDLTKLALHNPAAMLGMDVSGLDGPGLVYDPIARRFDRR